MQFSQHYSLEQANDLLPTVIDVFFIVRPLHKRLLREAAQMRADGFVPDLSGRPLRGKLPTEVAGRQRHIRQLSLAIQQQLRELLLLDIEIQRAEGIVGFKSRFEMRSVLLCWQWGQEKIIAYHELDEHYSERKPITEGSLFTGDEIN